MKQPKKYRVFGPCAGTFGAAKTGSWRLERPQVDFGACVGCGVCQMHCPVDVITIDKDSVERVRVDWNYCKGCGICANECPKKCIKMVAEGGMD